MFTRTHLTSLALALTIGAVIALAYAYGVITPVEEKIQDRFFLTSHTPSQIIIIAVDDHSIDAIGQWPWKREVFAHIIEHLQSARVVGFDIHFSEPSSRGESDDALLATAIAESTVPVIFPVELSTTGAPKVSPLPVFADSAHTGVINVEGDSDGVVRVTQSMRAGKESFEYLLTSKQVSPDSTPRRIAYQGPAHTYVHFSVTDLLDDKIPPQVLSGATVLVGATALSLHDTIQTPFGLMSGVEVHANAIETLERDIHFYEPSHAVGILLILLSALIALLVLHTTRNNFVVLIVSQLALALSILLGAILLFSHYILIPFAYMILTSALTAGALIAYFYIIESKEKTFIRKTFQYYLMPEIIDELVSHPERLTLGGEKRKVTVFFSDIRGFTTISEGMSPEVLTGFINEYLTGMTDIIMKHGGLVDKYIGDAIMAFWGAPLANEKQELEAVAAYKEMREVLVTLNKEWEARSLPPIAIGVGIATGDVIAGNMGSERRFNYTLMGDEVNFASRIESLTKTYGVGCLLSETTAKAVGAVREIDVVRVKGKKEPRKLFTLLPSSPTQAEQACFDAFTRGYEAYKAGSWQEAITAFTAALSHMEDGPSKVLLERSRELQKHPPATWDGVYEHHTK